LDKDRMDRIIGQGKQSGFVGPALPALIKIKGSQVVIGMIHDMKNLESGSTNLT